MQIKKSLRIVAVLLFTAPFLATASDEHGEHGEKSLKETIKEDIQHHVKDSHDFHLFTDEESGTHVGFPLPVILWDDGLHVFMSSAFHHGEEVAESNGRYYALYHGKIYNTNAAGELEFDEHGHPENAKPLDFSITKGVASIIIISLIVFLIFRGTAKVYGKGQVPKG